MASGGGPSWADQWGAGGLNDDTSDDAYNKRAASSGKEKKKMDKVKELASASFDKAKSAATVGADKAKSGTTVGIKWIKKQYQKRTSK